MNRDDETREKMIQKMREARVKAGLPPQIEDLETLAFAAEIIAPTLREIAKRRQEDQALPADVSSTMLHTNGPGKKRTGDAHHD